MPIALGLLLLATAYRILAAHVPALANFSPLMALTFCAAVYLRDRRLWLVPFLALTASDCYIDHYYATVYHYHWPLAGPFIRAACLVAALGLGAGVARDRSWVKLAAGCVAGSLLFYLVTNTASWRVDAGYAHDLAGWWQALTIGHPEFPPTLFFFRNSLASDLAFTGLFALAMELAARRTGAPSLLGRRAAAK